MTSLSLGGYFHRDRDRGDWLPPYIADVTDDGGGPESELMGGTPRPERLAARADPLRESRRRHRRADGRVRVLAIVANNLFDKAYLSAITENAAWLGAPRTISMTATVSF